MTISARIICDSRNHLTGNRLTTFVVEYSRFIHAEFMTHRMLSRNASSSRAIPIATQIRRIWENPAVPAIWGRNQKGMQAGSELTGWRLWAARQIWRGARVPAIAATYGLSRLGLHKQHANRLLEPWMHIQVVVSATEWENFFALRTHADAQPEIRELATQMLALMRQSEPVTLSVGEWHLPFVTDAELLAEGIENKKQASVARCARVSYLLPDGRPPDMEKDIALCRRLIAGSGDVGHWSPFEHVATPMLYPGREGNFTGWRQYRKFFRGESARLARPL